MTARSRSSSRYEHRRVSVTTTSRSWRLDRRDEGQAHRNPADGRVGDGGVEGALDVGGGQRHAVLEPDVGPHRRVAMTGHRRDRPALEQARLGPALGVVGREAFEREVLGDGGSAVTRVELAALRHADGQRDRIARRRRRGPVGCARARDGEGEPGEPKHGMSPRGRARRRRRLAPTRERRLSACSRVVRVSPTCRSPAARKSSTGTYPATEPAERSSEP